MTNGGSRVMEAEYMTRDGNGSDNGLIYHIPNSIYNEN